MNVELFCSRVLLEIKDRDDLYGTILYMNFSSDEISVGDSVIFENTKSFLKDGKWLAVVKTDYIIGKFK